MPGDPGAVLESAPRGPGRTDPRTLLSEEAAELLAAPAGRAARSYVLVLSAAVAGLAAWAALWPLESSVVARGTFDAPLVVVRAPASGTVAVVSVREGEDVAAGARLFELALASSAPGSTTAKAPVAGTVVRVRPVAGDRIAEGDALALLLPPLAPVAAEVKVSPGEARRLAPGQRARVRIAGTALPALEGTVTSLRGPLPDAERGVVFAATLSIAPSPAGPRPLPGLPASAEIATGETTALGWLLGR
jgi:multidrug resistance efflux pump